MRSFLLVPGDDPDALAAAFEAGADAIVIHLGASPDRTAARRIASSFLTSRATGSRMPLCFIGLQEIDGPVQRADLEALMPAAPEGFVLPRSTEPGAIPLLDSRLAVQEALHGLADGSTRILAAAGQRNAPLPSADLFRNATSRLTALVWCGGQQSPAWDGRNRDRGGPGELSRNLTLFAAAAAGLPAVHSAWTGASDPGGLQAAVEAARRDGFSGMLAVDAAQVATINAIFSAQERAEGDGQPRPPDATPSSMP